MTRKKLDAVIEAVRYAPDGQIRLVRLYERRGSTFSDHILLDRSALVERLRKGRQIATGRRLTYLASTFEIGRQVRLLQGRKEIVATHDQADGKDFLADVPFF